MTANGEGSAATKAAPEADWFEQWFGEDYLRLYPHRDETDAALAIELVAAHVEGRTVRAVLDLACGAGRHSRLLSDRWWTVGLDLSRALLRVARKESPDLSYVRADMRELPFAEQSFDLVVNLFTSFGYFDDDREHRRVFACIGSATKRGGTFVVDFLNPEQVKRNLVEYDETVVGGTTVEQRRSISPDNRFVQKTIRVREQGKEFVERVRLLSPADIEHMLTAGGFDVVTHAGDYSGGAWTENSPRSILFARRR